MSWYNPQIFAMKCDWCNNHSPERSSKQAAYNVADGAGWEQWSYKEHYCPKCVQFARDRSDKALDKAMEKDDVNKPVQVADCMYPWEGLDTITHGIRLGELVTITAGSGLGKSQLLREQAQEVNDE